MSAIIKSKLQDFCQLLLTDVRNKKQTLENSESQFLLPVYEEQIKVEVAKISKLKDDCAQSSIIPLLQNLSKLVFDITYLEECEVIEKETVDESSWLRVRAIIGALTSLQTLSLEILPSMELKAILGEELLECLWWRKGALLYMYSHMTTGQWESSGAPFPTHYQQCLADGVDYFVSMLCARSIPAWLNGEKSESSGEKSQSSEKKSQSNGEKSQSNGEKSESSGEKSESNAEDDESQLLDEGIWSDNHLLAMMYCGEMCYWHTKHGHQQTAASQEQKNNPKSGETDGTQEKLSQLSLKEGEQKNSSAKSDKPSENSGVGEKRNIVETGKICLDKFITVAQWPMFSGSWNTSRAEELLEYLTNL